MRYVGIDFSLTCPSVAILENDKWNAYFLTNIKKYALPFENVVGTLHSPYKNNIERYENIAKWALALVEPDDICYIEDYSLGSVGKVFNIAEATGILKYIFQCNNIGMTPIPPSQIKKFATGKGNATKEMMHDAFIKLGHMGSNSINNCIPGRSPLCDIIDAFWIATYAKENSKA